MSIATAVKGSIPMQSARARRIANARLENLFLCIFIIISSLCWFYRMQRLRRLGCHSSSLFSGNHRRPLALCPGLSTGLPHYVGEAQASPPPAGLRKGPHQQPGWHSATRRLSPLALRSHRFRWFAHSPVFARVPARARAALMAAHPPVSSPLSPSPPEKNTPQPTEKDSRPFAGPFRRQTARPLQKGILFCNQRAPALFLSILPHIS